MDEVKEYLGRVQTNFKSISKKYKTDLESLDHYEKLSKTLSAQLEEMKTKLQEWDTKSRENKDQAVQSINQWSHDMLDQMMDHSVRDMMISSLNEKIDQMHQSHQFQENLNHYTAESMAKIREKQQELNRKLQVIHQDLNALRQYKHKILETESETETETETESEGKAKTKPETKTKTKTKTSTSYLHHHYVKDILVKTKDVLNIFLIELPSPISQGFEVQKYYDFFDALESTPSSGTDANSNSNSKSKSSDPTTCKYSLDEFIEHIETILREIQYFVENRLAEMESQSKYQEVLKAQETLRQKYEALRQKFNQLERQKAPETRLHPQKYLKVNSQATLLKNNFNTFLSALSNLSSGLSDASGEEASDRKWNEVMNKSKSISHNINELVQALTDLTVKGDKTTNPSVIDTEINHEIMYKNNIQLLTDEISSLIGQRDALNDQILTLKEEQSQGQDQLNKAKAEVSFLRNNSSSAWRRLEHQVTKYDQLKKNYDRLKKDQERQVAELIQQNQELTRRLQYEQDTRHPYHHPDDSELKESGRLNPKDSEVHPLVLSSSKSNSTLKNSTSTEEIVDEASDQTNKYHILQKKYDFMREQYNRIKILNEENKGKVEEYTKKYNYVQNQYNKVRNITLERDKLLTIFTAWKKFATECQMPQDDSQKFNQETFTQAFIDFLRNKLSTGKAKERAYEELKDDMNELLEAHAPLLQPSTAAVVVEGKTSLDPEDYEHQLKETLHRLSESRDKLNDELTKIQVQGPEPKTSLELKIEKLKNNLKHQSNENRFLQQKLKKTEKSNEAITSKIANEFSLIIQQYDKFNEEISSQVHANASMTDLSDDQDFLSFNPMPSTLASLKGENNPSTSILKDMSLSLNPPSSPTKNKGRPNTLVLKDDTNLSFNTPNNMNTNTNTNTNMNTDTNSNTNTNMNMNLNQSITNDPMNDPLNNMPSESLLMDMTFWSTSTDDYSIEQNPFLQDEEVVKEKKDKEKEKERIKEKKLRSSTKKDNTNLELIPEVDEKNSHHLLQEKKENEGAVPSQMNDPSLLSKNKDNGDKIKEQPRITGSSSSSSNNSNSNYHQDSDIKSNASTLEKNSSSKSTTSSDNILILKHMFSKIIKPKNISLN